MELRPGYTQTEVGVIPENWECSEIGTFIDLLTGFPFKSSGYSRSGIRLLRGSNVKRGRTDWDEDLTEYWPEVASETRRYQLLAGDIVISMDGSLVGRSFAELTALDLPALLLQRVARVRSETVFQGYLKSWICSKKFTAHCDAVKTTTAIPHISPADIRTFKIAIPPTTQEQSAIATALSDMDALLVSQDALIAKQRAIKQGAMQELLTGKRRLPGFDGKWEAKRLCDLAKIQRGASPRPIDSPLWFDENSKVGWVRISDVTSSGMYLEETKQRLSEDGIRLSRPVAAGNLIMSICATVGRPVITKIDTCIHDGFVIFDEVRADQKFLYYTLKFIEPDWSKHGQTGSQMNLNTGLINGTEINLPSFEEQSAIAEVLSDIDAEISVLEAKRKKAAHLKQGMMQELLTGRTRLVSDTSQDLETSSNVVPFKKKSQKPHEAAASAEEDASGSKTRVHFMRSVFAAEIVDQLHNESTFGHVKFAKLIFLAEHLCKVDIGSNYHRDAAGPYDSRALRSIDSQMKKQKWFDAHKLGERYLYLPMENQGGHKEYFDRYYASIRTKLDEIIATFRTAKTQQCEIVATLYGAWDDLIGLGKSATDAAILDQVLNHWHDKKKDIPEDRWRKALEWMREKGYVPEGTEKRNP